MDFALSQMVIDGQFRTDSLVWKNRMAKWEMAKNIIEVCVIISCASKV